MWLLRRKKSCARSSVNTEGCTACINAYLYKVLRFSFTSRKIKYYQVFDAFLHNKDIPLNEKKNKETASPATYTSNAED